MGQPLDQIVAHYGRQLIGTAPRDEAVRKFPLLMKIIDAADRLSVQVHPNDEYAFMHEEGELGKAEMWYVISAEPGAKIVYGLKNGVTKVQFAAALEAGHVEELLHDVEVHPGDVFNIPAGLVHALGAGVVVAEVQQNSDTVYRVFDYNRPGQDGKPRELHVKKALDVIDFNMGEGSGPTRGVAIDSRDGYTRRLVVANNYFAVEIVEITKSINETADGRHFDIMTFVEGSAVIRNNSGVTAASTGDSVLIPASMGTYQVECQGGPCKIVRSYVPDLENDVVIPLRERGYKAEDAKQLVGGLS
jgi:mannose-6-phosphate isomerase